MVSVLDGRGARAFHSSPDCRAAVRAASSGAQDPQREGGRHAPTDRAGHEVQALLPQSNCGGLLWQIPPDLSVENAVFVLTEISKEKAQKLKTKTLSVRSVW